MSGTARQNAFTIGSVVRGTVTTGNNATFSHTVDAGSNLALLVLIGTHQGTISAVTWNGVALTKIDSGRSSLNECGDAWILINPTPATGNVVVTRSGGSWHGVAAINLSNVLQSVPTNKAIANGESSTPSRTITPTSDYNLLVSVVATETTISVGTGMTSLASVTNQSYEVMRAGYIEATDRSQRTMSFNLGNSKRWGMVAVAIEPAAVTETQKRSVSGTRVKGEIPDDFERAAIGSNYTIGTGWVITSGELVAGAANAWVNTTHTVATYTNVTVTGKIKANAGNSQLIVRKTGTSGYGFQIRTASSEFRLERYGLANLASVTKTFTAGTYYNVKATVDGSSIKGKVWEYGTAEPAAWDIDTTNTSYTSGNVGFSSEVTGAVFDNLVISNGTRSNPTI